MIRSATAVIERIAQAEAKMDGQFFFTDQRRPLKEALAVLEKESLEPRLFVEPDFGCSSGGICGI